MIMVYEKALSFIEAFDVVKSICVKADGALGHALLHLYVPESNYISLISILTVDSW